jgi:hypothetical protein
MSFLKGILPIKAKMWVQLDELAWLGQSMKGVVFLQSEEIFKAENVRLELRVRENYTEIVRRRDSKGNYHNEIVRQTDTHFSKDVPISEPFTTAINERKEFPFTTSFPTVNARHGGVVTYYLKAVANVSGRMDVTDELSRSLSEIGRRASPSVGVASSFTPYSFEKKYDPESGAGKNYAIGVDVSKRFADLSAPDLEKLMGGVSTGSVDVIKGVDERMVVNKVMLEGFIAGLKDIMRSKGTTN